jgi:hypothetical protein
MGITEMVSAVSVEEGRGAVLGCGETIDRHGYNCHTEDE